MQRLNILLLILLFPAASFATDGVQTSPVEINKALIKKIHQLKPDTTNALHIETMLGAPSACLPDNASAEAWVCQWKGNLASSGIANTLNIWFSAGMLSAIHAVDQSGNVLK